MVNRALTAEGLAHWNSELPGKRLQLLPRFGVMYTAARDDQRTPGVLQQLHRLSDALRIRQAALDPPEAFIEEVDWIVISVRLDILRQGQNHRAGIGRVG